MKNQDITSKWADLYDRVVLTCNNPIKLTVLEQLMTEVETFILDTKDTDISNLKMCPTARDARQFMLKQYGHLMGIFTEKLRGKYSKGGSYDRNHKG